MKLNRIALALMLGLVVTVAAQAQFTWLQSTDALVPNTVINDLYVDFAGDVPIVEMLTSIPPCADCGQGLIYQNPFGDGGTTGPGAGPPGTAILTIVPEAAFDTFVTLGSETSPIPGTALLVAGGAVDIGGQPGATFNEDLLDLTWSPAGGETYANPDPGGLGGFMARVTLINTAEGEVSLLLQDANGSSGAVSFDVVDGAIVPEPSSVAMLMLGLLAFLRRRV